MRLTRRRYSSVIAWLLASKYLLAFGLVLGLAALAGAGVLAAGIIKPTRYDAAAVERELRPALVRQGLRYGAPAYLRIIKQESVLELWLAAPNSRYRLFKTYPICTWSGALGPKLRQGDNQAPEGFYTVGKSQLNPNSRFHLAFNLGYPNAYDRANGRTGDFLMVHGNCVSIGCYAMGDAAIEEIYSLVGAALTEGQHAVPVHIFPFRLTDAALTAQRQSRWHSFWQDLQPAYALFEQIRQVPRVTVSQRRYVVTP